MKLRFLLLPALLLSASCGPKDGLHSLHVVSTNDTHATWFDSSYVDGSLRRSVMAAYTGIKRIRETFGADNVLLLDAGDCLQGDNAAYYYNYVDTVTPHPYPRIVEYMGYDAVAVGNHDLETGHQVYDRLAPQMKAGGVAWLAGNTFHSDSGKPYFDKYRIFHRAGLRVAVLGYTNPSIRSWVSEETVAGMDVVDLIPLVQNDVDMVRRKEKPDVVIALIHSGYGKGDGRVLENQGLDLYKSLRGVDMVLCSHDHSPRVEKNDSICLMNSGSHSRFIAHGTLDIQTLRGKVVSKSSKVELIPVKAEEADPAMREAFRKEYETVKAFTVKEIGTLDTDLVTRDGFKGMCPYVNLLHTVSLGCEPAQISFAAPLSYNKTIPAGKLVFNDLFTIYPFENQLYVLTMSGREIKGYLEASYEAWIQSPASGHILKIHPHNDMRDGTARWSFYNRFYNFDSAAGINYTVDVTKPAGARVAISSLADGSPFDEDATYNVAMTSYRAAGGAQYLWEGAGIYDTDSRIVARYPEIRNLVYDYILEHGAIKDAEISKPAAIGSWSFIPQPLAGKALEADMDLLF